MRTLNMENNYLNYTFCVPYLLECDASPLLIRNKNIIKTQNHLSKFIYAFGQTQLQMFFYFFYFIDTVSI